MALGEVDVELLQGRSQTAGRKESVGSEGSDGKGLGSGFGMGMVSGVEGGNASGRRFLRLGPVLGSGGGQGEGCWTEVVV